MPLADSTRPARAPRRFDLIGVEWQGPRRARIEVRARRGRGAWSEWFPATALEGHAPDAGRAQLVTDPVWTGPADTFQIRSSQRLRGVRVHFVDAGTTGVMARIARTQFVTTGLAGQPPIIARTTWSDRRTRPRIAPFYGQAKAAVIHHTVNGNGYSKRQSVAIVRAICLFHRNVHGWNDLGYNFLVDRFGQIFEGREGGIDDALTGAHAGGFNFSTTGIALIGSFAGAAPSERAFRSLAALLAWKLSLHGIPAIGHTRVEVSRGGAQYSPFRPGTLVRLNRIAGHRDADSTTCPGYTMYARLPRLRRLVARLQTGLSSLTATPSATAIDYPNPLSVSGVLATASGEPIAGVPVELQRRTRTGQATLATATTAPDGSWSAGAQLDSFATLRALYRGDAVHAAIVTPTLEVQVRPQVTIGAGAPGTVPGGTIEFSGNVTPVKERVTLIVSKQAADGLYEDLRQIAVVTQAGGFRRTIGFADPGRYQVTAYTTADKANPAARSAPAEVVVA